MRTLTLLTVTFLLTPAASAQSKIRIGDDATSSGTINGATEAPFEFAINTSGFLVAGGQIEVLPGTYVFTNPVSVPHRGVRIYGSKGAVLELAPGFLGPLFDVMETGADFVLEGLTLRAKDVQGYVSGETLIQVRAEAPAILDCVVEMDGIGAGGFALDLTDVGIRPPEHRGALVQGNQFLFATDATGWGGLRLREYSATRVIGNRFGPLVAGQTSAVRDAIDIHAGEWCTIDGNTFVELDAPLAADGDALVDCHRVIPQDGEGGHIAVNGNLFEDVGGHAILRIQAHGFNAIAGNVFKGPEAPGGAIRLLEGNFSVVHSNRFVNSGLSTHPSIEVVGGRSTVVSSCTFLECLGPQISCEDDAAGGPSITVTGSWFEASDSGSGTMVPAINLGNAVEVIVGGNTARNSSMLQWSTPMFLGSAVVQYGNNVF